MKATLQQVEELLRDRPAKMDAEEVGYERAPDGSAMRCGVCHRFYRRATDAFGVCELFRDDEADENGVDQSYRCRFFTATGDTYPLLEN